MALATWWYEDGVPDVRLPEGYRFEQALEDGELAAAAAVARDEVVRRRRDGHRAYLILQESTGTISAYGWVASRRADVDDLGIRIHLSAGDRYLWHVQTLPLWGGRGLDGALLAAIVSRESPPATRLWTIHARENGISAAGIRNAGFVVAGELSYDEGGRPALRAVGDALRAAAGARLLGLPLVERGLSRCWRCGPAGACDCPASSDCGCHASAASGDGGQ